MLGIEQFTTKQDTNGKILAFDTRYVLYLLQGMSYICYKVCLIFVTRYVLYLIQGMSYI